MKDYYRILHVSRFASNEEIKRSYRRLALRFHPDVSEAADAHLMIAEINEAYQILNDPTLRTQYDNLYYQATQDINLQTQDSKKYRRNVVYKETKKVVDNITPVIKVVYKWMAIISLIFAFFIFLDWIMPSRIIKGTYYKNDQRQNVIQVGEELIFFELNEWVNLADGGSIDLIVSLFFGFTRSVQFSNNGVVELFYVRDNYFSIFLFLPLVTSVLGVILLTIKEDEEYYAKFGTANAYLLIIQTITVIICMNPFL